MDVSAIELNDALSRGPPCIPDDMIERYFHRSEWLECLQEIEDEDGSGEPQCFRFSQNEVCVGLLPVWPTKAGDGLFKRRVWRSCPFQHAELHDLICDRPAVAADAMRACISARLKLNGKSWDLLVLGPVLEDSNLMVSVQRVDLRLVIVERAGDCSVVDVCTDDELLARLSENARHNLRRARKRLSRYSSVEFLSATRPSELQHAFSEFTTLEASGWKGADGRGTAIALSPHIMAFYDALIRRFSAGPGCEVNLLRVDGHCIAGQFTLLTRDTSYLLKVAYDEKYSDLSPSHVLMAHQIARYAQQNRIGYVNLTSHTGWHEFWRPRLLKRFRVTIGNNTARGMLEIARMRLRTRAREIYRTIKDRWRQLDRGRFVMNHNHDAR